jgi:hypothetical protein
LEWTLSRLAHALSGEVCGRQVLAPGPGHSPSDRSLAVRPSASAPDGMLIFSHAADDWRLCRDHVRARLGITSALASAAKVKHSVPVPASNDEADRIARAAELCQGKEQGRHHRDCGSLDGREDHHAGGRPDWVTHRGLVGVSTAQLPNAAHGTRATPAWLIGGFFTRPQGAFAVAAGGRPVRLAEAAGRRKCVESIALRTAAQTRFLLRP